MDMDSTLINIECIDEIADFTGKKAAVSEITEATMRGEIKDFKESLRRRVALLAGVSADVLDSVYKERLRPNPGALELLAGAHPRFNAGVELKALTVDALQSLEGQAP